MDAELAYLKRYPDVAGAIKAGTVTSALEHFLNYGRFEGRVWLGPERTAAGSEPVPEPPPPEPAAVAHNCDAILLTQGFLFVDGWVDDRFDGLAAIEVAVDGAGPVLSLPSCRYRRQDVEQHLGLSSTFESGFWQLFRIPADLGLGPIGLRLRLASGRAVALGAGNVVRLSLREHFEAFLGFYGRRQLIGSLVARSFSELGLGLAGTIEHMHNAIRTTRAATSEGTYGRRPSRPLLSFVCCIYGIPDFLFLQVAQFARYANLERCEFIYVNNSPELEEVLHRDAEIAAFLFRTSVSVISLNQNTGFSHANNVGIAEARSQTIVVINPDVFPYSAASFGTLSRLAQKTRHALIGGKLFYADGTVMHGGMIFIADPRHSALARTKVWTVEHPRKGFPDLGDSDTTPVPAVSGALMVFDRADYDKLGGFDERFIYGHYEDADLCLRFADKGWKVLYDASLTFWHYEGRGSIKRPEHAGAVHYNRWLFSRTWSASLSRQNSEA
ncbi:MAG: glycosyltransferase [Rhodospirillales bacterium]|nr:glycosyltransferase [Rhodospirillales bacterium]